MNMTTTTRQMGSVTIVDISGRIIRGEESSSLHDLVSDQLNKGHNWILLNLAEVNRIDTAGWAHLIASLTSVRKAHGELKLLNPIKEVRSVMQLTKMLTVFDVRDEEASAVKSFGGLVDATAWL